MLNHHSKIPQSPFLSLLADAIVLPVDLFFERGSHELLTQRSSIAAILLMQPILQEPCSRQPKNESYCTARRRISQIFRQARDGPTCPRLLPVDCGPNNVSGEFLAESRHFGREGRGCFRAIGAVEKSPCNLHSYDIVAETLPKEPNIA